jgi:hypothetical protein
MLAAAFENAASDNPEHWAAAAATCRRLLMAASGALRPPGPDVNDRRMTGAAYINRLVDSIVQQSESDTASDFIVADLEYLGRRLDAVDDAGNKGAHTTVSRLDAARFLTGTYLALGTCWASPSPPMPTRAPGRSNRGPQDAVPPGTEAATGPEHPGSPETPRPPSDLKDG